MGSVVGGNVWPIISQQPSDGSYPETLTKSPTEYPDWISIWIKLVSFPKNPPVPWRFNKNQLAYLHAIKLVITPFPFIAALNLFTVGDSLYSKLLVPNFKVTRSSSKWLLFVLIPFAGIVKT